MFPTKRESEANPQVVILCGFFMSIWRSVVFLKYRNAKTILPERLLKELQQYIRGEIVYVPGDDSVRAGWGENNGTREKYVSRNKEIITLYRNGISKEAIADRYHLSEYSINKIVHGSKHRELEAMLG